MDLWNNGSSGTIFRNIQGVTVDKPDKIAAIIWFLFGFALSTATAGEPKDTRLFIIFYFISLLNYWALKNAAITFLRVAKSEKVSPLSLAFFPLKVGFLITLMVAIEKFVVNIPNTSFFFGLGTLLVVPIISIVSQAVIKPNRE
jgi:hypothetical protein